MHRRHFLLLGILAASTPISHADVDLTPVKKWIDHQAGLKTLEATFRQLRFMKAVKKPLESSGRIWYAAPGSIRWESGDPPKVIATVKSGGSLTVQHVDKKTAEVFSPERLKEKSDGHGVAFLESGFPKSLTDFQKQFEITAVEKIDGFYKVETKLAEGASSGVRKFVFFIQDSTWTLGGIHFYFRDGSRVESTFSTPIENKDVPASRFEPELSGYTVEKGN